MNKDKEWLKEKLKGMDYKFPTLYKDSFVPKGWIIDLINQLDEPELPVIPQFVADFIKERTENENGDKPKENSVYNFIDNCCHDFKLGYYPEIKNWYHTSLDNQIKFELAWLYGYTIEPPKTRQVLVKFFDNEEYKTELTEDAARELIEFLEANKK